MEIEGRSYVCPNRHTYDIAKSGYVNMLPPSHGGVHGDDKLMVASRRDFLELGYYQPLRDTLASAVRDYTAEHGIYCDAGCGEGYYTITLAREHSLYTIGADMSRDALALASKRFRAEKYADAEFVAASVYEMPIADGSCDVVTSAFSPYADGEFRRILRRGGVLIRAIPLERHLWGLKSALYEKPYENEVQPYETDGWKLLSSREIKYSFTLKTPEEIAALLAMTPYYYKTSPQDRERLLATPSLTTEAQFCVLSYERE